MAKNTIAFISTYEHHSRDSVESMVRSAFPEYRLEDFPLSRICEQDRIWMPAKVLAVATDFGVGALLRPSLLRSRYFQTKYLFRRVREAMRRVIDPARHVFSFQTQSMYDTSVPGVPHFVYTDHTHLSNLTSPYFDRSMLRSAAWVALERTIYENAARVFTRSSDVTADLQNRYGIDPEKVACVRCGSNVDVAENFAPDNAGYANRHILFVGQDWERKGGDDLVAAFRRVLSVYPDAQLTIIGARPVLDLPNCNVLGKVPLAELTHWYAKASVFCLPTRLEPFGVAFLEAMHHRLPIVATAVGAVPDMVLEGVNGHLVAPGDPAKLAEALIGLLGDPARCRQLGEAGYRRASQDYTWDSVGRRIRSHVLSVMDARLDP
jgi:glycosyltransferase involved in cell wall biosynthesis